ncbi:MAG: NERD domain-containing protein [Gammaproteobacteria bacterium]|nr:NERD domain-containing protein [Gammaproteobacteria bacterium]
MIAIALIIIGCLLFWFIVTRPDKGKRGERRVSSRLSRALDAATYRVIDDVTLPTRNGTTQIDHLVVSPHGVFVIETKNFSGWIFGREDQQRWTQVLYERKSSFFNPIRQNRHHIKTVQSLCHLRPDQTFGYVVFTGDSTFKTDMPASVVQGVPDLVRLIESRTERVLSNAEVTRVLKDIASRRLKPGRDTDRLHRQHATESARRRSTGCPHCGSSMVERTNRATGEVFLGCHRYPDCKGTRQLA